MDKPQKPEPPKIIIRNDGDPFIAVAFVMIFALSACVIMGVMFGKAYVAWYHRKCEHAESRCVILQDEKQGEKNEHRQR